MNHASTTSSVLQSFKVLWQWLMAKPGQPLPWVSKPGATSDEATAPSRTDASALDKPTYTSEAHKLPVRSSRPVRVLQVMESGQNPNQSGRLRISGRMADVCAELDRLAAREALQH
ncbi:hypothetical protein [Rhodoferax sp. BLA1]|uniref:hypothetical protein n=1 Tax=Rhodoferax sp. BLA1 TaxID=2576062 RepID=UPI0015D3F695|nr:hypothetical protein [Rhodoferax sp. BLA1]